LSNPQEHINGAKSHKWIIHPIAFLNHAYMSKDEAPGAVVVAAADSSNLCPYLIKLAKPHASGETQSKDLITCKIVAKCDGVLLDTLQSSRL
jgi:fumarate hydratase class II